MAENFSSRLSTAQFSRFPINLVVHVIKPASVLPSIHAANQGRIGADIGNTIATLDSPFF